MYGKFTAENLMLTGSSINFCSVTQQNYYYYYYYYYYPCIRAKCFIRQTKNRPRINNHINSVLQYSLVIWEEQLGN